VNQRALAVAEPPAARPTLATRSTLTGDWFGARTSLADRGITFDGNITQFAFGLDGGVNRALPLPGFPLRPNNSLRYTGRGDYGVTFDLEKLIPQGA
jgi:carbohydrate-selective porin OprB